MPIPNVPAAVAAAAEAGSPTAEVFPYSTRALEMNDFRTNHFVLSTDDDQAIHTNDDAARAVRLPMRIMHGALVRDIAVNTLVLKDLARRLETETSHMAKDLGGDYVPHEPVFPGEHIYVRYNFEGRVRPRGTFPVEIKYAVYVIRDEREILILTGNQKAQVAFLRNT